MVVENNYRRGVEAKKNDARFCCTRDGIGVGFIRGVGGPNCEGVGHYR